MVHDGLLALPGWLQVGLALGLLCSFLVAALFLVANRWFPSPTGDRERASGENRRRAELREYLDAIEEPYAEDHFVGGQQVAFYLPARDVAITFDARAYYRIERSDTYAVLVEHEMPGLHLGSRLPFEVPDVDVAAGDPEDGLQDPAAAAFAELDVPPTATMEEVRAAYRRKVKEVHPDQGGDEDAFRRVREAYTTAKKNTRTGRGNTTTRQNAN